MEGFDLVDDDARELRAACVGLNKLNPRGSWCLAPIAEPEFVIAESAVGGEEPHDYLKVAVEGLQDLMPTVSVVRTEAMMQSDPGGKIRRRTWVRFQNSTDHELAAIDTATMPTHIRDGIVNVPHPFILANQVRMQAWATQLGTPAQDMPELLHLVSLCVVNLQSTEIRLRPAAAS